jgi:hypothetical protein
MIIGTVRKEEAIVFDSKQGYHSFTDYESKEQYGSFEVFWFDGEKDIDLDYQDIEPSGWFWWSCFAGCLPDGEKVGPFASSEQAYNDANEVD